MKTVVISAATSFLVTVIGGHAWSQTAGTFDGAGERHGHNTHSIFVDANTGPGGDGTETAPYQTITEAMQRAREIRQESRHKIVVRVAPGEYVEDFPIYVNVSNFELRGSTQLIEDEDGLPQNCGSDDMPAPCLAPGTESVIAPIGPLAPGQIMLLIAPTKDSDADQLTDVTVRGFLFDGRAINVATSGDGVFVNRVEHFTIQDNVIRQLRIGIGAELSSGRIEGNFAYNSNDGLGMSGGSLIYPARVEVRANRLINNLAFGALVAGAAAVKFDLQAAPNMKELQTVYDPTQHPEQVPDTLTIVVVGNDFSHNPNFGLRFESFGSGNVFYDTTDNQPMTSHIRATVRGNSCTDNGEYGFLVEGGFPTRSNPRTFTAEFTGSFEDNALDANGRAGLFVGFMANGVVTRNPGLINQDKYVQESRFKLRVDEESTSFGIDYDNPVLDPFDRTTPLNNTLIINGARIIGTRVTCPPGFPCVP